MPELNTGSRDTRIQMALDSLDDATETVGIELRRADRLRREAEAKVSALCLWIDSVGRTCPSNATISEFLLSLDDPDA
ncbi:MAG TPA: hypothetical protein VEA41_09275 [Salinarimonas sp.]|nr:hypothetical protein [Salinarimonas sp.]